MNLKSNFKVLALCLMLPTSFVFAKVSSATITLIGRVPEIASLSTVSLKSDLDLRPGTFVKSQKIGQVQVKVNSEISGIFVSSSTKSGTPENESRQPFHFSRPFTLKVDGDCNSLDTTDAGIILGPSEKEISSDLITDIATHGTIRGGMVENCDLSASWSSENVSREKANSGLYSMYITVTLVSL